ncbi:MAG: YceI family protein, partial [Planctomycetes bacterium]|nr:YceI family protein [Planctomycetota bacterium]
NKTLWLLVGSAVLFAGSTNAAEDARGEGAGIVVPDEHAKLGEVYYVLAAKAPHVTFRSNAKVEKIKGTSLQLAGYVVTPTSAGALPAQLAAGKFVLPVISLDTGNASMNEHMQAKRWLDNDGYPVIEFTITDVTNVKLVREREDSTIYRAKLVGTLSLVGQEKEMTVNARITLKPESEKTRKIAPGDLMTIRSNFNVVLSEFGMGINDPGIEAGKIAKKIKIDVNLTLSTLRLNRARRVGPGEEEKLSKVRPAG